MIDEPDSPVREPRLKPYSPVRRDILKALGLNALALAGMMAGVAPRPGLAREPAAGGNVATAPVSDRTAEKQPFLGEHQAGVVTPRPACGMVASFDVLAQTPDELVRLFRTLTERTRFLMEGGTPPVRDPRFPPTDSGILGPVVIPDNLTVTVSVGSSLFDGRFGLGPFRPKYLERMTAFPNDALNADLCHGDLSIQLCANTADTTIHALRDIVKNLPDLLWLRWKQEGAVPVLPEVPDRPAESARNFLGFRDGSANPDANDTALMNRILWVQRGGEEPEWMAGGTYQAVRIIRNFVERWDRTPLREQERIFGRARDSGAPLDGGPGASEFDVPDFGRDPDGVHTPHDSHIRLANPRTPESETNLILRRPFNYSNGVTKSGQLDMGLLFICYQANLLNGFITVQRRLDGEPLEEYIKPVGGGYFFTLPGVRDENDFFARPLLAAAHLVPAAG
ncbi:deferrochelatase/peroxidase EfeB [Pseudochelatococcus lubricantis]|uniref:Deferrochelatase n=1 Tax=Pseudochelatococcus lubricantis TaxID=1538102 RepID=A0ABX0V1H0_9HYPH|nr:iron uptake transporter deferrochelatase/peroxidase subunit [Pseudochelatococcus lubricantis]NIJ58987.1 deferrochelatase/peroxidase EfeB [Pseudochelatococcus lubricantis]